jgi:hypothetical protein
MFQLAFTWAADRMGCSSQSSRGNITYLWYTVGWQMSENNVWEWINIKLCLKIGKSASETLDLLNCLMVSMLWRNWVYLNAVGSESWPKKWAARNPKEICKCGQSMHLGALRLKNSIETISRRWLLESVRRKGRELWPHRWILHHDSASVQVPSYEIHYKSRPCTLYTWLSPLRFLALSKTKTCPEGTKICWHLWQPVQHDNSTVRYSEKRFSGLFPAMTPPFHKLRKFTRRVFWRHQQLSVHR